jgi:hypothetical protein
MTCVVEHQVLFAANTRGAYRTRYRLIFGVRQRLGLISELDSSPGSPLSNRKNYVG